MFKTVYVFLSTEFKEIKLTRY